MPRQPQVPMFKPDCEMRDPAIPRSSPIHRRPARSRSKNVPNTRLKYA